MKYNKQTFLLAFLLLYLLGFSAASYAQDAQSQAIKFGRVLRLIETFYVDTANVSKLTENAIGEMLSALDPHSVYITKDEVEEMNQPLEGNFEGIGISFNIYQDTLIVLTTIPGGPSEKVGLRPGDRIIKVDEKAIAAVGLKSQEVFGLLRGDKGTKVRLIVLRKGESQPLEFTIVRDKIPIYSVDASFMLDKSTAYIKLNRFSATTMQEYTDAMKDLQQQNKVRNLVLDLRGNGGGFLGAAYELANQFLDQNKLIVYTEGTHSPRRDYISNTKGTFLSGNLVVLIDEGSASASEIVAGAVQDWDRGVLVGRRTFGKGLVQQPFPLNDGSMIRLTVAHYYTPAGRNIQRPYSKNIDDYRQDYFERYENGELFNQDSIKVADSLMTATLTTKRKVYGGGGIVPDLFVAMDTSVNYRYFNQIVRQNILFPFVIGYIDQNRTQLLKEYPAFDQFNKHFELPDAAFNELVAQGDKAGITHDETSLAVSGKLIRKQIKALISRDLYESENFYSVMVSDDPEVKKALDILSDQEKYNSILGRK